MPDPLMDRVNSPNYLRSLKIMRAMGLEPRPEGYMGFGAGENVLANVTGFPRESIEDGLNEWEQANPIKLMLGRLFAKNMLNQETLQKYRAKAQKFRGALESNPWPEGSWGEMNRQKELAQLQNMESRFNNPKTMDLLNKIFGQLKRPSDIDNLLIEDVRSNISYK